MTTIWKAILNVISTQEVEMPVGAQIICALEQFDRPCIWFTCDPEAVKEYRRITIIGTNDQVPSGTYVGTVSTQGGRLMLHIFEG